MSAVDLTARNGGLELGRPVRIIDRRPRWGFDVAPDGRILAAQDLEAATGAAPPPLTLVQNWTEAIQK